MHNYIVTCSLHTCMYWAYRGAIIDAHATCLGAREGTKQKGI